MQSWLPGSSISEPAGNGPKSIEFAPALNRIAPSLCIDAHPPKAPNQAALLSLCIDAHPPKAPNQAALRLRSARRSLHRLRMSRVLARRCVLTSPIRRSPRARPGGGDPLRPRRRRRRRRGAAGGERGGAAAEPRAGDQGRHPARRRC